MKLKPFELLTFRNHNAVENLRQVVDLASSNTRLVIRFTDNLLYLPLGLTF